MINKKIALSAMSILASLALLGGATFALFSDEAQSTGNTFSTGNASLLIADDDIDGGGEGDPVLPYTESIPGVNFSNISPGFTQDTDFWLKNDSAGSFSMDATADLDNLGGGNNGDLPDNLMVQFRCDTNGDGLGDVGDTVTPNKFVNAWIAGGPESLGSIGANEGVSNATTTSDQDELLCRMTASLGDVGNDLAGTDLSFDGIFDGTQVL